MVFISIFIKLYDFYRMVIYKFYYIGIWMYYCWGEVLKYYVIIIFKLLIKRWCFLNFWVMVGFWLFGIKGGYFKVRVIYYLYV